MKNSEVPSKMDFPGYPNNPKAIKNILPPFAMIRAGALRPLIPAIIGATLTAAMISNENYQKSGGTLLLYMGILLFTVGAYWGKFAVEHNICEIKEKAKDINNLTKAYIHDGILNVNSSDKQAMLILKYIAKRNPGIFDKFIQNPNSLSDMTVAENILLGHLKSHPADAQKILDVFNIDTMPKKLHRRAMLYSERVKSR